MKNVRHGINKKLWHNLSDPLWESMIKSIGDPLWGYTTRSLWSNVSNVIGSSSGAGLPFRVGNFIKYRS